MRRDGRQRCRSRFDRCFLGRLCPTTDCADRQRCGDSVPVARYFVRVELPLQQGVVLAKIRCRNVRVRGGILRPLIVGDPGLDGLRFDRSAFVQQLADRCFDGRFAFGCGQMKDRQVLTARPARQTLAKFIVGHGAHASDSHFLSIPLHDQHHSRTSLK